jgi:hypothetical protein
VPKKGDQIFWPSFSDLMTSLFFVVLVLFTVSYANQQKAKRDLEEGLGDQIAKTDSLKKKLAVYDLVETNLKPLREAPDLFQYDGENKRFTLAFNPQFREGFYKVTSEGLFHPEQTIDSIDQAGQKLQEILNELVFSSINDSALQDVSYLLIIAGYASRLGADKTETNQYEEYNLSYKRAYYLWNYWKEEKDIDFEDPKFKELIDLQITGNGWGGVGRFAHDGPYFQEDRKNQRFIIQIVPKISNR